MFKISCPCGYVHDMAKLDDGYLTVPNRDFDELLPKHVGTDVEWRQAMSKIIRRSWILDECPECGRLTWVSGEVNGGSKFYSPDDPHVQHLQRNEK